MSQVTFPGPETALAAKTVFETESRCPQVVPTWLTIRRKPKPAITKF